MLWVVNFAEKYKGRGWNAPFDLLSFRFFMTPKKYRKFRNFWHCWYVEWEQFVSFWNNLCQRLFAAENLELDNFNALPQCPVKYDKVLGRSLSKLTLSGAFRFKNSISFKLCPWIFYGLRVFRVNAFHTSCLLYTLLLTKKVLLSLSMEIGTLCAIFAEVLHLKVQWFAPNKIRTLKLFDSAHYTRVVLQHKVTWIRLQCSLLTHA